jgi:hypothetical protein
MNIRPSTPPSVRTLGLALAAATVALPVAAAQLLPLHTAALAPLALLLPFVTMGLLDAALRSHERFRGI